VGPAMERLKALALKRLYLTNSISRETASDLPIQEVDLSPLLVKGIDRLHRGESIVDLLVRL
jgi:phosphoribosylpyrophosphate synthetase